ncbi:hypothetical protein ACIHEI_31000 [Kitasatospora sp. NPDC051984]|uniref:hypothetical protein n=1 Tax=Kitasatospora sp. NPDC051984 TaxID=3364059 RepID=UPI0037C62A62
MKIWFEILSRLDLEPAIRVIDSVPIDQLDIAERRHILKHSKLSQLLNSPYYQQYLPDLGHELHCLDSPTTAGAPAVTVPANAGLPFVIQVVQQGIEPSKASVLRASHGDLPSARGDEDASTQSTRRPGLAQPADRVPLPLGLAGACLVMAVIIIVVSYGDQINEGADAVVQSVIQPVHAYIRDHSPAAAPLANAFFFTWVIAVAFTAKPRSAGRYIANACVWLATAAMVWAATPDAARPVSLGVTVLLWAGVMYRGTILFCALMVALQPVVSHHPAVLGIGLLAALAAGLYKLAD